METYFLRKRSKAISRTTANIKEQELIIKKVENKIEKLKLQLYDASTEYFCGYKISYEEERDLMYGMTYELKIELPEHIRITASVHPDAHEEESVRTFISRLELSNYYYGKIPYLVEFKSRSEYNIKNFEDAKTIALTFLKEFIDSIPNKVNMN